MAAARTQRDNMETSGRVAGRLGTAEPSLAPPTRRVRLPELALGLVLMALFALAGVLWHLREVDRVPALAVAAPIERGASIEAGDLRVMHVASDNPLARIDTSAADQVIGQVALVDLAPGMLVTEDVVADPNQVVGPSDGVVGLPLDPGQYPVVDLAAGDRVNVVQISAAVAPASGAEDTDDDAGNGSSDTELPVGETGSVGSPVVASDAEVTAVVDMTGGERKLVSLRVPRDDAERIASLDSSLLQLVQVER